MAIKPDDAFVDRACLGPVFQYSDSWQLVINTGTTIVTSLMVFLIQNTQNRDARAIHLKLDELIRADKNARNHLIDLETLSDDELEVLHQEFCQFHDQTQARIEEIEVTRSKKRLKKRHHPEKS